MATTNLISTSFGDALLECGNGVPDHTSPKGSMYMELNSSPPRFYKNTDGAITWLEIGGEELHSARVFLSGTDQTITKNVDTKIQFNSETWDPSNEFDSTTNYRFTPTKAGKYHVHATCMYLANNSGDREMRIYKNGTALSHNVAANLGGSQNTHVTISDTIDMNGSTDYIEIFTEHNSSIDLDIDATSPHTHVEFTLVAQ